jgi:polyhydroxyalkanoate synthesis repressor PhaR
MENLRIIKKYANRRLYDTAISQYVTLAEIKKLVLSHVPLQVVDANSKQDITNQILLQIISEEESKQSTLFTTQALQHIIRFYDSSMRSWVKEYIDTLFNLFASRQEEMQHYMQQMLAANPVTVLAELTQKNLAAWRDGHSDQAKQAAKASSKSKKPESKK